MGTVTTQPPKRLWALAVSVAVVQIAVAIYAQISSNQSILSDGACYGGLYGSLANMALLAVVAVTLGVTFLKSYRAGAWSTATAPLLLLVLSTGLAILIGLGAGLRCTV